MSEKFLSGPEDMSWLRSVHLHGRGRKYKSAILVGNEDAPKEVHLYRSIHAGVRCMATPAFILQQCAISSA